MENHRVYFYELDGALFFHLDKPSIAGAPAIPFTWDGVATETQKNFYKREYEHFLKEKEAKEHVKKEMAEAAQAILIKEVA